MTTIHTRCPDCDKGIILPVERVTLLRGPVVLYGFECPGCEAPVVKSTDEKSLGLLELAGVSADAPVEPAAPLHPELPAPGPALTRDDLLALHERLARDNWLADLLKAR